MPLSGCGLYGVGEGLRAFYKPRLTGLTQLTLNYLLWLLFSGMNMLLVLEYVFLTIPAWLMQA